MGRVRIVVPGPRWDLPQAVHGLAPTHNIYLSLSLMVDAWDTRASKASEQLCILALCVPLQVGSGRS